MGCLSTTDGYGNQLTTGTETSIIDDDIILICPVGSVCVTDVIRITSGFEQTLVAVKGFRDACTIFGKKLYDSEIIRSTLRVHNEELKKLHELPDREEKQHHIKKLLPWQLDFQKQDRIFITKSINKLFGRVECLRL